MDTDGALGYASSSMLAGVGSSPSCPLLLPRCSVVSEPKVRVPAAVIHFVWRFSSPHCHWALNPMPGLARLPGREVQAGEKGTSTLFPVLSLRSRDRALMGVRPAAPAEARLEGLPPAPRVPRGRGP